MGNHTSPDLKDEFVCCGKPMMPGYVPGTYYCETCIQRKRTPLEKIMYEIPKISREEVKIIEEKNHEQLNEAIQQIMQEEPNTPPSHTFPNLKNEFVCCNNPMLLGYIPGTYFCEACGERKYAPLEKNINEMSNLTKEEVKIIEEKIHEQFKEAVQQIVEEIQEEPNTPPQNQLIVQELENLYLNIPITKQRSHHMTLRLQPRLNYNEYFGRPRKRRRKL